MKALVVSPDPAVREGWARALESSGMSAVMRCVGPDVNCVVMRGERCPLLEEAGLALYHEPALKEPFLSRLRAAHASGMVVAARDRLRIDGDHEPAMSHLIHTA